MASYCPVAIIKRNSRILLMLVTQDRPHVQIIQSDLFSFISQELGNLVRTIFFFREDFFIRDDQEQWMRPILKNFLLEALEQLCGNFPGIRGFIDMAPSGLIDGFQ